MISVTILTKNSAETVADTLRSLRDFAEVLVCDTGSTDDTLKITKAFPNVRVVKEGFQGFGPTHNLAAERATHDWILSIDSDEVVSPELAKEIRDVRLSADTVYSLDRHNFFHGKRMRCWRPDRVVRLYHRTTTQFNEAPVHEAVMTKGLRIVPLSGPLLHTPYRSIDQLLAKMQLYTSLFASRQEGHPSSLGKAVAHSLAAFLKSYFLKRGFFDGKEGFILSLYNAHTAYYKYLKIALNTSSDVTSRMQGGSSPTSTN